MKSILEISQVVISVILIILVLLQQRGSGLGSVFGGGGEAYHQRRGMEKWIFRGTVVSAFIFLVLSIATFLVQ